MAPADTVAEKERRDPFLKFFHSDWQSDEALQLCSLAARGLWLELILYMHKAERYGYLLINGHAPSTDELIRRTRPKSRKEFTESLAELRENGVYSVNPDGVIYCRRMVRRGSRVAASRENGLRGGRPSDQPTEKPRANLDGNLDTNLDRNLEKTPIARSQKPEARNQKPEAPPPRPFAERSKRPIFKGQRFTVFEWFLDRAGQILGNYLDSFDLHAWFYTLDAATVKAGAVVPEDSGKWLAAELLAEARRRKLQIAGESVAGSDPYANFSKAWTCAICGEIHEGTADQARRRICLKNAG